MAWTVADDADASSTFYPNVTSSPVGTVYTPGPGQPGFVSSIITHYTFLVQPACSYTLSPSSVNVPAAGGHGSFTVTPGPGCPIAPGRDLEFCVVLGGWFHCGLQRGTNQRLVSVPALSCWARNHPRWCRRGQPDLPAEAVVVHFEFRDPSTQKAEYHRSGRGVLQRVLGFAVEDGHAEFRDPADEPVSDRECERPIAGSPLCYAALIIGGISWLLFSLDYFVQGLPSVVPIPSELTFNYSTGGSSAVGAIA